MSLKIQAHSAVDFKSLRCLIVEFKAQDAYFMIFYKYPLIILKMDKCMTMMHIMETEVLGYISRRFTEGSRRRSANTELSAFHGPAQSCPSEIPTSFYKLNCTAH